MRSAGIDIGSRTVKLVIVEDGQIVHSEKQESSFDPLNVSRNLLNNLYYNVITATGYGRHLFATHFSCEIISEIKAFAIGARALLPSCQTILDIGGQDTKAISLEENGKLRKFEMNDKCAAGTGRFLEIMAMSLGYSLSAFGQQACLAEKAEKINSMCTVFAESEVVSMVARRASPQDVAFGIHQSIINRSLAMLKRVSVEDDLVFAGGVALNRCIKKLLESNIGKTVHIPQDPQIVGALGCALYSQE